MAGTLEAEREPIEKRFACLEGAGHRRDKSMSDQFACTPDYIYDALNAEFDFDFDPAPINPTFDGLSVPWGKRNYINPPYNDLASWVRKGISEMSRGVMSVFLIPFRPQRLFFWDLVMPNASEIRFFQDNVTFKGYKTPARFGVCIAIFRPTIERAMSHFTMMKLPSPKSADRTVAAVQRLLAAKWSLVFDYVSTFSTAAMVKEPWGQVSFVCAATGVEQYIDRCEEIQKNGGTVVLLVPLRHAGSSYFVKKIVFGGARAVYAVTPPIVCEGYTSPSPDGNVALLYGPGDPEQHPGPRYVISDIRRPPRVPSRIAEVPEPSGGVPPSGESTVPNGVVVVETEPDLLPVGSLVIV